MMRSSFVRPLAIQAATLLLWVGLLATLTPTAWGLERRKPQFSLEPAHFFIPAPYSIPGVGTGLALAGMATNMFGTHTDALGAVTTGALQSYTAFLADMHLMPEHIILDVGTARIQRATVTNYTERGMDSSADKYQTITAENSQANFGRLTFTAFERRLEFQMFGFDMRQEVTSVSDAQGHTTKLNPPLTAKATGIGSSLMLDYTDDYDDPRVGVRLYSTYGDRPRSTPDAAAFNLREDNLTGYIPVGEQSTWVFHAFYARAVNIKKGQTDPNVIRQGLHMPCESITDPATQASCTTEREKIVKDTVSANTYGTATALGGSSRLRSYPRGRFRAGQSQFVGTEFRWNLTNENTPMDIFVFKDVRTAMQLSVFYEVGTVAETEGELWKQSRYSTGVGFRLVGASGLVYRIDVATGQEGNNITILIGYPWETF